MVHPVGQIVAVVQGAFAFMNAPKRCSLSRSTNRFQDAFLTEPAKESTFSLARFAFFFLFPFPTWIITDTHIH